MKVGPWQVVDGFCIARVIEGGDPDNIADRVAFIEKTPRVRIRSGHYREDRGRYEDGEEYIEYRWHEFLDWAEGAQGLGPDDPESQQWCDDMLKLLGYEI
jgi:hypothetical protein